MKKIVLGLAFVLVFLYVGISTVSAEEYEVEKGDSLWKIADKHDMNVDDLIEINELKTSDIHPKQELAIHETYEVEKGDTLSEIAEEFDVSVDDLKEWNELDDDVIAIDQELEIQSLEKEESSNKSTDEKEKDEEKADEEAEDQESDADEEESDEKEANEQASGSDEEEAPEGETIEVSATAYTAKCEGCSGVTSTGVDLNEDPDAKVIAVDPDVIPLGSEVYVEGYGYATAEDTGGAINGNKIDLHVPSKEEASEFGVQTVDVTIVD